MHPDLFASDTAAERLGIELRHEGASPDAQILADMAWALRQRDPMRARDLACQAAQRRGHQPRLDLIKAEVEWQLGDLDQANQLTQAALDRFTSLGDEIGRGDAFWLLAYLARESGHLPQVDDLLGAAEVCYGRAGDKQRGHLVRLRRFMTSDRVYQEDAGARWEALKTALGAPASTAILAWHEAIESLVQGLSGNLADSVVHGVRAHHAFVASGQIRMAVICAMNASTAFLSLNDLDAALEWAQRALENARRAQSRSLEAQSLARLGSALLLLDQVEAAKPLLEAALEYAVAGSVQEGVALTNLGYLALAMKDGATAYARFSEAERVDAARPASLVVNRTEKAKAGLMLGRTAEVHALCDDLLRHSRDVSDAPRTAELLFLKARICQREREDGTPSGAGQRSAMDWLLEALQVAESTDGMATSYELLDALADEAAYLGDMARAFSFAKRAHAASEAIRSRRSRDRAIAMQIQLETQRLSMEADHLRERGLAEVRRSEQLAQANATLEQLATIGREITAAPDERQVFERIEQHVRGLLDVRAIAAFRLDATHETLEMVFGRVDGQELARQTLALDDPVQIVCRCARERREFVIDSSAGPTSMAAADTPAQSQMVSPLQVGKRVVGVLTIDSTGPQAYGERELAIFRSLCAYGAIALVNAQALADLKAAQTVMAQQNAELEQLAATDRLTGLANRRQLDLILARELARAGRSGAQFSLLMLDIDHFKRINDAFGHLAGDEVLENVGRLLRQCLRGGDLSGRWGGEEFLIILPDTDLEDAERLAESLRVMFERFKPPRVPPCTASVGVACYLPGDDAASITERADRALYLAKKAGRNRAVSLAGHAP